MIHSVDLRDEERLWPPRDLPHSVGTRQAAAVPAPFGVLIQALRVKCRGGGEGGVLRGCERGYYARPAFNAYRISEAVLRNSSFLHNRLRYVLTVFMLNPRARAISLTV